MRGLVVLLILLVPFAGAVDEAEAPALDPRVAGVGHSPEMPAAREQWTGFIEFEPGHNVTNVTYFICRIAVFCLQPEDALRDGDRFHWDTNEYRSFNGKTYDWGVSETGEDWFVGYKFVFTHEDGSQEKFPKGLDPLAPDCDDECFRERDATNYFTFHIQGDVEQTGEAAPLPAAPLLFLGLLMAVRARKGTLKPVTTSEA